MARWAGSRGVRSWRRKRSRLRWFALRNPDRSSRRPTPRRPGELTPLHDPQSATAIDRPSRGGLLLDARGRTTPARAARRRRDGRPTRAKKDRPYVGVGLGEAYEREWSWRDFREPSGQRRRRRPAVAPASAKAARAPGAGRFVGVATDRNMISTSMSL